MQYSKNGDMHLLARTSGPCHNFLGIEFSEKSERITVEMIGLPTNGGLSESIVKEWVSEAINEVNQGRHKCLHVRRIRCVADDDPRKETYKLMAKELWSRATEVSPS